MSGMASERSASNRGLELGVDAENDPVHGRGKGMSGMSAAAMAGMAGLEVTAPGWY